MKHVYFFTGFPGFISNQLIRELKKQDQLFNKVIAIVLPSVWHKAVSERLKIINEFNLDENQFILIEGDITKPGLNISKKESGFKKGEITHFFHLAAIYDLAVPKNIAYLVNVDGTHNVNDYVLTLPNLLRYTYFSTAYVAGRREGKLYEHELIKPDKFKNSYEETKYEAEVLVRKIMDHVPVTVIRPGIVKGNTLTGETIKFDGPYFILNFLDRIRYLPIIPNITKSTCVINLVPVDYIVKATAYLTLSPKGAGKTYHLTDPNPYTVTDIYKLFLKGYNGKRPIGYLPFGLTKMALSIKPIRKFLGVEVESLDYFTWKGEFDCVQAQADLAEGGILCPDFKEGVVPMVEYYRANKNNRAFHIEIT
ncbi:SDR family oxidoreductase [Bacillus sp. FJAT-27986]|uniref:SDR family oxidoreductase n=1 Tax=Bacillus sp. FJAT-27986 TaxID=1743146 RepID=UPI00080AF4F6|nr:SDR family oxidoreductase [Bacillus sp. FJAT-27986]OCA89807.1 3-beta hydroxysteroid dehydrogenase [Bacillus sp. FJAT-27986]